MKIEYSLLTLLSASMVAAAPHPFVATNQAAANAAENAAVPAIDLSKRHQNSVSGFRKRTLELRNTLLAARGSQLQNQVMDDGQKVDSTQGAQEQAAVDEALGKGKGKSNTDSVVPPAATPPPPPPVATDGKGKGKSNTELAPPPLATPPPPPAAAGNATDPAGKGKGKGDGKGKGKGVAGEAAATPPTSPAAPPALTEVPAAGNTTDPAGKGKGKGKNRQGKGKGKAGDAATPPAAANATEPAVGKGKGKGLGAADQAAADQTYTLLGDQQAAQDQKVRYRSHA